MIKEAIKTAVEGNNLAFETAKAAMDEIMRGEATAAQIAAFLTALRMKGESIDEITACAPPCAPIARSSLRYRSPRCRRYRRRRRQYVQHLDGDGLRRGRRRRAGGQTWQPQRLKQMRRRRFLEALGANINLTAEQSARVLRKTNMCFMFAPNHHASMKYAAPVRKEIGARTIFNILGPLSNPAFASIQLMGVYDEKLVLQLARVLSNLGVRRALVVHGDDGLDEITLTTTTTVCEVLDGELQSISSTHLSWAFHTACRATSPAAPLRRTSESPSAS